MWVWLDFGGPVTINRYWTRDGGMVSELTTGEFFDDTAPNWGGGTFLAQGSTGFRTIGEARRLKAQLGGRMFRFVNGEKVYLEE